MIARVIAGMTVVAGFAATIVAPAIGAPEIASRAIKRPVPSSGFTGFTPAAADPRLAAAFARAGLDTGDFRFTPSENRQSARAVTVAVRSRTSRAGDDSGRLVSGAAAVGLAPIAYNLGVSVGWKKFALSGDMARVDLAGMPGGRDMADVGVSYSTRKFTGKVSAGADRPAEGTPKLIDDIDAYSLDLGGSYSLTRNLDVTAGLRYKSERDRLARFADDRRDSQAVYVGTAFRF